MLLRPVTPHQQLDSVLDLDAGKLAELGIRALLLDVDCTLKDHQAASIPPTVVKWLDDLKAAGIRLCIVSNGKARRIGPLADSLGVASVTKAFKPFPFGCRKALRQLGVSARETAIIGDQIFADVMAGRLAGLRHTFLVRPTSLDEPWFTKIKRPFERIVLWWLNGGGVPRTSRSIYAPTEAAETLVA